MQRLQLSAAHAMLQAHAGTALQGSDLDLQACCVHTYGLCQRSRMGSLPHTGCIAFHSLFQVLQDCEQRYSEERQTELLDLIKEHLAPYPRDEPPPAEGAIPEAAQ